MEIHFFYSFICEVLIWKHFIMASKPILSARVHFTQELLSSTHFFSLFVKRFDVILSRPLINDLL